MNKIPGKVIAPEGRRIVITLLGLAILLAFFQLRYEWNLLLWLFWIDIVLLAFCLNFFRDPSRTMPDDPHALVAPADGKVVRIIPVKDPEVGEDAVCISIFLDVFNVHANRMPIDGTVTKVDYRPGKFLAAYNHNASDENEQTEIQFATKKGKLKIRQIAGLIARRILCYGKPGLTFKRGDRFGFIMFGSRTDIILPGSVSLKIEVGQKTKGGETIIGEWK